MYLMSPKPISTTVDPTINSQTGASANIEAAVPIAPKLFEFGDCFGML